MNNLSKKELALWLIQQANVFEEQIHNHEQIKTFPMLERYYSGSRDAYLEVLQHMGVFLQVRRVFSTEIKFLDDGTLLVPQVLTDKMIDDIENYIIDFTEEVTSAPDLVTQLVKYFVNISNNKYEPYPRKVRPRL